MIAELEKQQRADERRLGRTSISINLALLALGVALILLGVRDDFYVPATLSLAAAGILCGIVAKRSGRHTTWLVLVYALQISLFARALSPLVIAPLLVAVNLAAWPRRSLAWSLSFVALGAVISCELLGLVTPTTWFDGILYLRSPVDGLAGLPLVPILALGTVLALVLCGLVAHRLAAQYRRLQTRLHVSSWQLRQLAARD